MFSFGYHESVTDIVCFDRNKKREVDSKTLATAVKFHWSKGGTRVHVQQEHVGIYGQWIDSYRPRTDTREIALILEDDLSVFPYTYRWLKAARDKYGSRKDIAGYTLQSEGVRAAKGSRAITAPRTDTAFLYKLLGSLFFFCHIRKGGPSSKTGITWRGSGRVF